MRCVTWLIGVFILTCVDARVAQSADRDPLARRTSWGEYWDSWSRRPDIFWRIIKAPKLQYRVESLEVYPNGVWAEFGITNRTGKSKYLDIRFLVGPVMNMGLSDADGRDWQVPRFHGDVSYGAADEFVYVPADATVWYRHRLTFNADRPLELVRAAPAKQPGELTYWILGWTHAYTRLTEERKESKSVCSFGGGRVSVKWFDKPYPSDWQVQSRYFGSKSSK